MDFVLPLGGLALAALGFYWANIRHSQTIRMNLLELNKDLVRFVISNPTKREAYIEELRPALELARGGAKFGDNIQPKTGEMPGFILSPGAISEFTFVFPWSIHEEPGGLSTARIGIYVGWIHGEGKRIGSLRWLTRLAILPDGTLSWFSFVSSSVARDLNVSDK